MAAVRTGFIGDEKVLEEETLLEKTVAALAIHNKKRWHGGKGRAWGAKEATKRAARDRRRGRLFSD